jgi:uncharacterized protein
MMKHQTLTIDTSEFTRRGDVGEGTLPIASLPRLATLLLDDSGGVAWQLAGRVDTPADGGRRPGLTLALECEVRMRCVRCLEPVEVKLSVNRNFRLSPTELQAAREDADDDEYDVLVESRRFDVAALVEDEALMALPFAPRHDDCQPPAGAEEPAEPPADDRPNPFALLQQLRPGRRGDS